MVLKRYKEGGEKPFGIFYCHAEWGRYSGINFFRRVEIWNQLLDVIHTGKTGYRHECQQTGNDQKEQVITGIDRSKTDQERNKHIECSGSADLQAKGNAMPAMIVRIIPPGVSRYLYVHSTNLPDSKSRAHPKTGYCT